MTTEQWAPARIWLQREQGDHGSHTWCEDSVGDGDMIEEAEYVRVDAVPEPVAVIGSTFQLLYCREKWSEGLEVGMPLYTAPPPASTNRLTDDLLVQLFYAAQGDITQFRIKARTLLEAK